jgi:hypothetical protein
VSPAFRRDLICGLAFTVLFVVLGCLLSIAEGSL